MEQIILISTFVKNFTIPLLVGSKVFFSVIVAPTTFKNLDEQNARKFIRSIFPKLYLWCFFISLIVSFSLLSLNIFHAFLFFIVSSGYYYSREFLMKKINFVSDNSAEKVSDNTQFKKLHNLSVIIFISQLILMISIYFIS